MTIRKLHPGMSRKEAVRAYHKILLKLHALEESDIEVAINGRQYQVKSGNWRPVPPVGVPPEEDTAAQG